MADQGSGGRSNRRGGTARPPSDLSKVLARLEGLEKRLEELESAMEASRKQRGAPGQDLPGPAGPPPAERIPAAQGAASTTGSTSAPHWRSVPAEPPESPPAPLKRKRDLEEVLGANWLAKAGIAIVALGFVFLFQYAVVQGWLTLGLQVALGVAFGAALFGVGEFLFVRQRLTTYAQILAGGGAAIVYFSVFASYVFLEYREAIGTTLEVTAILLALVALAVLVHAVLRRMPVLASVAMTMGAITVVFASEWPVFAAVYVLVLTAAVMGAGLLRDWESVVGVALGAALASLLVGAGVGLDEQVASWSAFGVGLMALATAGWSDRPRVGIAVMPATGLVLVVSAWGIPDAGLIAGAILALAVTAMSASRRWHVVQVVGLSGGYAVALLLGIAGFASFTAGAEARFAVLHLVMTTVLMITFLAATWWSGRSVTEDERPLFGGAGAITGLGAWGLVTLSLESAGWGEATGWATMGLAVLFIALAAVPVSVNALRLGWLVAGIVMALAWPPILLDGSIVTLVWTAYLAAAATTSLFRPGRIIRIVMGLTSFLVTFHVLFLRFPELLGDQMAWWVGLLVFGSTTVALIVAWAAEHRREGEAAIFSSWSLLTAAGLVPILYFAAVMEGFLVSVAWAGEAFVLIITGFALKLRELRLAGLAVFGIVLFRLLVFDMQEVDPGLRIVTFIVVGLLALLAAYFFARRIRGTAPVPVPEEEEIE